MTLTFEQKIHTLVEEYQHALQHITSLKELEQFRITYLSSKGKFAELTELFKALPPEIKRTIGSSFQNAKALCLKHFDERKSILEQRQSTLPVYPFFDPSLKKGQTPCTGKLHPYTTIMKLIEDIFTSMGFEMVHGTVVEDEYNNFTALNIPEHHPARASHDTFWLAEKGKLLRTHTTCVDVKEARKRTPPFGLISAGPVYRNEATDASHDFMFWQFEGLYIAKDASFAQLLFVLKRFLQMLFEKEELTIRTRPSHFPFVEPGLEVDMSCPFCTSGCSTCKHTQWIEMGGAGMVHPFVLGQMNINYPIYTGFAFGFGLTRLAMLKYQIHDIRDLHGAPKQKKS